MGRGNGGSGNTILIQDRLKISKTAFSSTYSPVAGSEEEKIYNAGKE